MNIEHRLAVNRAIVFFAVGAIGVLGTNLAGCKIEPPNTFSEPDVRKLIIAAENGDEDAIAALVKGGVNPNARGVNNTTPLLEMFFKKKKEGFRVLIRAGADPNLFDDRGRSVMHFAAAEADSYWLELSLKHGGKANLLSPGTARASKGITPIFYAAEDHCGTNVKLLIDAGADINHTGGGGMTVLGAAAARPAYDMVYILIEAGADFRKKDAAGEDLVDWISSRNEDFVPGEDQKVWFRKTVKLLESKGVEFKKKKS